MIHVIGPSMYIYIYIYICIYVHVIYEEEPGTGALSVNPFPHGTLPPILLILAAFYRQNGPVEFFMRWVPTSRFEHSSRELLALYICRDMTGFVVPGGPWGSQGRPRGVPGASLGGHGGSQGRAQGSQARPWGR